VLADRRQKKYTPIEFEWVKKDSTIPGKKDHFDLKDLPCPFFLNLQKSRVFYLSFLTNVFGGD